MPPARLALLHRRQHAGRDRTKARRFASDRAALVSSAVSEKLIKVRLDHPIGRCIELSKQLCDAHGLQMCEVVPADPASMSETVGVAEAAAAELERYLVSQHPMIIAMGTGRMLRAMAEQVSPMDCPQHKIVSLVGNIAPEGSASLFDVVSRIGDRVKEPHYPMPLPVIANTVHEKSLLLGQKTLRNVVDLARQADVTFVGIARWTKVPRSCATVSSGRTRFGLSCGQAPWARSPDGPSTMRVTDRRPDQ